MFKRCLPCKTRAYYIPTYSNYYTHMAPHMWKMLPWSIESRCSRWTMPANPEPVRCLESLLDRYTPHPTTSDTFSLGLGYPSWGRGMLLWLGCSLEADQGITNVLLVEIEGRFGGSQRTIIFFWVSVNHWHSNHTPKRTCFWSLVFPHIIRVDWGLIKSTIGSPLVAFGGVRWIPMSIGLFGILHL